MTRATTESADFAFTVKEGATGHPSILLEPRSGGLSAIGDGFLTLVFREGLTLEHAEEIARELNKSIAHVSHTRFGV